jgi:transposase-like protein
MRYPASEKLEIIKLVEGSHLSARQTLSKLGLPRPTFYRWYDRYLKRGEAGLHDQAPKPAHVWNRIPDKMVLSRFSSGLFRALLAMKEIWNGTEIHRRVSP